MELNNVIAQRKTKTVYKEDGKTIKLFVEDYSKANILNEALNQARVETTGLNIPKILEVTQTKDGEWVIVTEFIEGKTLQQLMEENPDEKEKYMEMFIKLQIEICSNKCTLLTKLKDKMTNKIELANIDSATKYELRTRLEGIARQNQLCHGDFIPSNVILKEDGTLYILDWAHATQGAPCCDCARTYLTFCLDNDFDTANQYLEMYCNLSNIPTRNIQRWLPIVAASQSVKNVPEERELLLSWINVQDFE